MKPFVFVGVLSGMHLLIPSLLVFGTVMLPALWFLKGLFKWAVIVAGAALVLVTLVLGFSLVFRELQRLRKSREIPTI